MGGEGVFDFLMKELLATCTEAFFATKLNTHYIWIKKIEHYWGKNMLIMYWTWSTKTATVAYLHMSVESWVPKVYSVEAILLMSSTASEKELLLHSSNKTHSYSCTRLCSVTLTDSTHSCIDSVILSLS